LNNIRENDTKKQKYGFKADTYLRVNLKPLLTVDMQMKLIWLKVGQVLLFYGRPGKLFKRVMPYLCI
jgi:hypothetical protein